MRVSNSLRALTLVALLLLPGLCLAQWSQVRQAWNSTAGASPVTTTVSLTTVSKNDVVIASVIYLGTATGFTMALTDGNGHSFTQTTNSPCVYSTGQKVWLFYIVSPALATMTITATPSVAHGISVHAIEFTPPAGTVTFDKDVCANPTTGTTPVNTPSITPAFSGVLYAAGMPDPSAGVGQFTGAVGGGWTFGTGGVIASDNNNSADEWQVSAVSATSANFITTGSSNTGWVVMAMSLFVAIPPNVNISGKVIFKGTVVLK